MHFYARTWRVTHRNARTFVERPAYVTTKYILCVNSTERDFGIKSVCIKKKPLNSRNMKCISLVRSLSCTQYNLCVLSLYCVCTPLFLSHSTFFLYALFSFLCCARPERRYIFFFRHNRFFFHYQFSLSLFALSISLSSSSPSLSIHFSLSPSVRLHFRTYLFHSSLSISLGTSTIPFNCFPFWNTIFFFSILSNYCFFFLIYL